MEDICRILVLEDLKAGDKLNIEQIRELSDKYEVDIKILCMYVLRITESQYYSLVRGKCKSVVILKEEITEEKVTEIRINEELTEKIDYSKILELSEKYRINPKVLAKKMGILHTTIDRMEKDHSIKTKLPKLQTISISELPIDILTIIQEENLLIEERINGARFLTIASKYKISEKELAKGLLLSQAQLRNILENSNGQAVILKGVYIPEQKIEELREKMCNDALLNEKELFSYEDFKQIAKKYKIDEKTLIGILEISLASYKAMKHNGKLIKLFSISKATSRKVLIELSNEIFEGERLKTGQLLTYSELEEISKKHNRAIDIVCKALGVKESMRKFIRDNNGERVRVRRYEESEVFDKIKSEIKSNRFYQREELEAICMKYGVNIEFVIKTILKLQNDGLVNLYIDILQQNGKLWLGNKKISLSEEFANNNAKMLLEVSKIVALNVCRKFRMLQEAEDFANDAVIYTMQSCGEFEKNFQNDIELIRKLIFLKSRKFLTAKCLKNLKIKQFERGIIFRKKKKEIVLREKEKNEEENGEFVLHDQIKRLKNSKIKDDKIVGEIICMGLKGYNKLEILEELMRNNNYSEEELIRVIEELREKLIKKEVALDDQCM